MQNVSPPRTLESIGKHTVAIVAAGAYDGPDGRIDIASGVGAAIAATTLRREDELVRLVQAKGAPAGDAPRARVRCLNERSGACAARLLAEGARHVGVLNYANGVRPGGGFLHGARAQEEALCRMSALYACISQPRADVRFFFDDNLAAGSALVRGHVIVSPAVPFFRNEELDLLAVPYPVTVFTAAAPDLGWLLATTSEGLEPKERFDEVPDVFRRRTLLVLAAAAEARCDAIVLGPWGCGAFGNDPEVVAAAFALAVARYADTFKEIVFSTWGPGSNREAFERHFKPGFVHIIR